MKAHFPKNKTKKDAHSVVELITKLKHKKHKNAKPTIKEKRDHEFGREGKGIREVLEERK